MWAHQLRLPVCEYLDLEVLRDDDIVRRASEEPEHSKTTCDWLSIVPEILGIGALEYSEVILAAEN